MEIRIRGVSKYYFSEGKTIKALDGVDLTIPANQIFTLLGPSGCGKTTLLNCLSGLDAIDDGEVLIEGVALSTMSDRQRTDYRARRMGFVFQFYNLMPVLTAVENVELPLLYTNLPARERRERARVLHAALSRLSERYRAVLVLHDLEELSITEVAPGSWWPMLRSGLAGSMSRSDSATYSARPGASCPSSRGSSRMGSP